MVMNGRADVVGPEIQLGDFLPERRKVSLNGNVYMAWVVTNRRYPRDIMAKLDRAARAYNRVIAPLMQPLAEGEEVDEARLEAADLQPEAYAAYVTEAIRLLVPGTTESELQLVDLEVLYRLGQELGYFPPDEVSAESTEVPATEEPPLTGDSSPESSADSIPATESVSS